MNTLNIMPVISRHDGITVVRDDMFPGGTKARFLHLLYTDADELVYASPPQGGAQTALAHTAKALNKAATIFVAARGNPHPRTRMARRLGANVQEVRPGYLSVVQSRASTYVAEQQWKGKRTKLVPFGCDVPEAPEAIAAAALMLKLEPREVWCAGGSGVLARGLGRAWPGARRYVVQVGRHLAASEAGNPYQIIQHPLPFEDSGPLTPFNSDPHYDCKAWEICRARADRSGLVVFWNVTGPAAY